MDLNDMEFLFEKPSDTRTTLLCIKGLSTVSTLFFVAVVLLFLILFEVIQDGREQKIEHKKHVSLVYG